MRIGHTPYGLFTKMAARGKNLCKVWIQLHMQFVPGSGFIAFFFIFFINKYRPTCHWKSFEIYVWHKIILRWSFFFTGSIFTPTQTNENKNMEHLQGLKRENLTSFHNIHFSCTSQFFSIINWVLLQWKCRFFLETWSDNRTENRDCFHFKE